MTTYRTVLHVPVTYNADGELDAEAWARATEQALTAAAAQHVTLDGAPRHDTPVPIETVRLCAHCHRPARQPVLISRPGEPARYACLPVCPPRTEEAAAA